MANNLGFKITAEDQASRVVETVQNKVQNFGRDVAKMALGFAGPLALVQLGFQKIGDYIQEQANKRQAIQDDLKSSADKELQENSHRYNTRKKQIDEEIASIQARADASKKANEEEKNRPTKLQMSVESFLRDTKEGQKIVEEERKKIEQENEKLRQEYLKQLKYTIPSGSISSMMEAPPVVGTPNYKGLSFEDIQAELSKRIDIQQKVLDINNKINQEADTAKFNEELKILKLQNELKLLKEIETQRKIDLDYKERIKKAEIDSFELLYKYKNDITVSNLREVGGSKFGERQAITAQQNTYNQMTPQKMSEYLDSKTWEDSAKIMHEAATTIKATFTDFEKMPFSLNNPNTFSLPNPLQTKE